MTTKHRQVAAAERLRSVNGLEMYYEIHGTGSPLMLFPVA